MATSKSPTLFDERFGEDNGRRRVHFDLSPDGREAYWLITQRMRVVQKRRRQMIIIAPTATIASKIATSQSSNDVTMSSQSVRQLRLVVTTDDFAKALHFYRDTLGLAELPSVASPGGQVAILDAGRATLEIADPITAEFIDQVEVGRRTAGHIRVAFEVNDAAETTSRLEAAGATVLAKPRATPFKSVNALLGAPAGLQLTLFQT